jgi:nitroreductase
MKTMYEHPWNISVEDFPANGTTAEKWKFFLRYAVLAPSSHNSQPWLFYLRNNTLELYADRRRACHWVRSMPAMPARKISAKNAAMLRPSATDAAPKAPRSRPTSAGSP